MTPAARLASRRATVRRVTVRSQRLWAQLDTDTIAASWRLMRPAVVAAVASGQTEAAEGADLYVTALVEGYGRTSRPSGSVVPAAFAGVASDGRELETLLDAAPLMTLKARSLGAPPREAKAVGLSKLVDLVATQVYDAGRVADSAAAAANRTVTGYRRELRDPSCRRCVVLAGRFYRWNSGFLRHPRCDCVHVPSVSGETGHLEPQQVFEQMDDAQQDSTFGRANAQAIRDGADIRQVVNAERGMKTTRIHGRTVKATTEGTTDTGFAGRRIASSDANWVRTRSLSSTTPIGERRTRRRAASPRLMPEQIYADAVDRDDAIRLLRRFGFIV